MSGIDMMLGAYIAVAAVTYPPSEIPITVYQEQRYCGVPARDADGKIKRSRAVLRAFAKIHPCPATGKPSPSCPGWAIDHVIPLACGGCDAVSNLQWLPNPLKSSTSGKDRFERIIYCPKKSG